MCENNSQIVKQIYLGLNNEYIGEDTLREIIRKITFCKNGMFKKYEIYGFRGANPKALLDFKKNYLNSSMHLMQQNYLSTKSIVEAADRFIRQKRVVMIRVCFVSMMMDLKLKEGIWLIWVINMSILLI